MHILLLSHRFQEDLYHLLGAIVKWPPNKQYAWLISVSQINLFGRM